MNNLSCCENEVTEFHRFLEQWLRGDIDCDKERLDRISRTFSGGCVLISPRGMVEGSTDLCKRIVNAYASCPGIRIWITDLFVVKELGVFTLVRYAEWRKYKGKTTVRLSTALLAQDFNSPLHVSWHHIHETWMAEHGPQEGT